MPALEKIRELYPEAPSAAPEAREQARAALVARTERPRRRLPRRALLPAAGLAVATAAVVVALVGAGDKAVVDPAAAALLRDAAAKAKVQTPQLPLSRGRVLYVKSVNAYMATWAEAGFSVQEPHVREIWLGPDGGLLRQAGSAPRFLSDRDRRRWIAAGRPKIAGGRDEDSRLPAQEPSDLPENPNALFAAIEDEARGHSNGTHRQMFTRVADYFRETNLSPAQRAALYEVAARIPGVEHVGETTDAIGRRGVAVAMENRSDGERHTLVIDPETGTLLAEQQVTLANNFYGYPAGTVVGHATYVVTAMVERIGARPQR